MAHHRRSGARLLALVAAVEASRVLGRHYLSRVEGDARLVPSRLTNIE